ncbi:MAG: response regulator [Acidobacteriota bacterium]
MKTRALSVLLVEDSASDAALLQEHLVDVGFERFKVTHVERLDEALVRLGRQSFDVVLLDLSLPDSSGVETLVRIQREVPGVPVVVLTGLSDQTLAIEAVRHGVQDYLIKGQTDERQIARAIRYAIERQRMEKELRRSEERYRRLADRLERRVEERTSDLRGALLALEQRTAQLRSLAGQLTQAEERERRRLAQAIHDHLQQLLVAAKLYVQRLNGESSPEANRETVRQIDQILTESIQVTRSLTFELSPPVLYDRGLAQALEWLGDWMKTKHGLAVKVTADEEADPGSQDVRVLLFQATRELLFNVVKHAQVQKAEVWVGQTENELRIVVSDQGVGFDPGQSPSGHASCNGFGLFSIRERLELVGGKMAVESTPRSGSRFTLTVPVSKPPRFTSGHAPAVRPSGTS